MLNTLRDLFPYFLHSILASAPSNQIEQLMGYTHYFTKNGSK